MSRKACVSHEWPIDVTVTSLVKVSHNISRSPVYTLCQTLTADFLAQEGAPLLSDLVHSALVVFVQRVAKQRDARQDEPLHQVERLRQILLRLELGGSHLIHVL